MISSHQKKSEKLNVENNKFDTESKQQVAILWNELDYSIAPLYLSATQEANKSYIDNQNAVQELTSYSTAPKRAAFITIFTVSIAAIMDSLLWTDLFQTMDALNGDSMARAIGLTVAIFATIACAGLGRAIKLKSTHKEGMRKDSLGISQYDNFTLFQKQVFDKNTTHDWQNLSLFTLGLCSFIIPIVRWASLPDTITIFDKFLSVAILSAVSYFIFAAVILLEIYNHCIWTKQLNISYSDYRTKVALHIKITKQANKIGKDLIQISLAEREAFKAFMSNKNYQLLNENTVDSQLQIHTSNQSQPTSSTTGTFSVVEDDIYLSTLTS
jgi:hypothetical protein